MSRIADRFAELKTKGEKGLVTFITAGDPDLDTTGELILEMEKAGADIIELGVPFSDPMADGPTIQLSSERALAAGTTLAGILALVKSVRSKSAIPIVLMGYYNPVFVYGVEQFVADAVAAGVDGVLLVDLPPEESAHFKKLADAGGLDLICLLTPTSDAERIGLVAGNGRGFLYYVSVTGVTGARSAVAADLAQALDRIRQQSSLPVAVGFGVSDAGQVEQIAGFADGVVVGSAIVKLFERYSGVELKRAVGDFVASLKQGTRCRPAA